MKPTSDDFAPRRDGWMEHRGTWGEVTVGTVVGTRQSRTDAFEVIATAHGSQVEFGKTLWFQMRNLVTGDIIAVEPQWIKASVVILTRNPADTQTPEPSKPSDSDAIMLLIKELGAETLAWKDEKTGEIWCPDYAAGGSHLEGDGRISRGWTEHLALAHNITVPTDRIVTIADLIRVHVQAHDLAHPEIGKTGFPHRHGPDDLSQFM